MLHVITTIVSQLRAYRTDSDWRELYLTYNGENWQTSLGWQQSGLGTSRQSQSAGFS